MYQVVAEQLETFLAWARDRGRPPPRFVEREFRRFLQCGILAHGFLRVHCDACGCDRLVPFPCKGRGFCNSCGGRRMAMTFDVTSDGSRIVFDRLSEASDIVLIELKSTG